MLQLARRGLHDELTCVIETDAQAMLQRYRVRRAAAVARSVGRATAGRLEAAVLGGVDGDRLGQETPQ